MKKFLRIIILLVLICLIFMLSFSFSKYSLQEDGTFKFTVAKPVARVDMGDEIYISNYEQRPLYFSVHNFDETNKISETAMDYTLKINVSQANAPLKYKLYRIFADSSQEEVNIKVDKGIITSIDELSMQAHEAQTYNYKLEFIYDKKSKVQLNPNIKIDIDVIAEQKRI